MESKTYRDSRMEQELRGKIHAIANERHGGAVPADMRERIAADERHIFGNGHGTLLAVAARLAEFSESRGCPVGFRGLTGNLYLSHLLSLAAVDPHGAGPPLGGLPGPGRDAGAGIHPERGGRAAGGDGVLPGRVSPGVRS